VAGLRIGAPAPWQSGPGNLCVLAALREKTTSMRGKLAAYGG
jgi:hypothetical protein